MQTILRGKERKTGKSVEIPTESYAEQTEKLHQFYMNGSAEFSEIGIYFLEPKQVVSIKESEPAKPFRKSKSNE